MSKKLFLIGLFSMALLSCHKEKATKFAGIYQCSCTHKIAIPGTSGIGLNYDTSLEFVQDGPILTVGDWSFCAGDLNKHDDSFEEELDDGSEYSVDFNDNSVVYSRIVPTEDGTSKTNCSGTKSP